MVKKVGAPLGLKFVLVLTNASWQFKLPDQLFVNHARKLLFPVSTHEELSMRSRTEICLLLR